MSVAINQFDRNELNGKRVLITGVASGMGKAIEKRLATVREEE